MAMQELFTISLIKNRILSFSCLLTKEKQHTKFCLWASLLLLTGFDGNLSNATKTTVTFPLGFTSTKFQTSVISRTVGCSSSLD